MIPDFIQRASTTFNCDVGSVCSFKGVLNVDKVIGLVVRGYNAGFCQCLYTRLVLILQNGENNQTS